MLTTDPRTLTSSVFSSQRAGIGSLVGPVISVGEVYRGKPAVVV